MRGRSSSELCFGGLHNIVASPAIAGLQSAQLKGDVGHGGMLDLSKGSEVWG